MRRVGAGFAQGWSRVCTGLEQALRRVCTGLEQGWRSGESVRPPPTCPEFASQTALRMSAEFAGSLPCSVSPRVLRFPRFLTVVFNLILFGLIKCV